jgi:FkbM family methyltransferase
MSNDSHRSPVQPIGRFVAMKRIVPHSLRRLWRSFVKRRNDSRGVVCYSQEGEDIVLSKLFAAELADREFSGFYIDVGAHHPKRFSNTYFFYRHGWSGINIDAMPGSMRSFLRCRRRDVNIEAAVSDDGASLEYCAFEEPAYNGFLSESSRQQLIERGVTLIWTKSLVTRRLDDILAEHLPAGQAIHFLSVDVEGHDLAVLRSLDWMRYRPRVVVVELSTASVNDAFSHPAHRYLASLEYVLSSKLCNSCIYVSNGVR